MSPPDATSSNNLDVDLNMNVNAVFHLVVDKCAAPNQVDAKGGVHVQVHVKVDVGRC